MKEKWGGGGFGGLTIWDGWKVGSVVTSDEKSSETDILLQDNDGDKSLLTLTENVLFRRVFSKTTDTGKDVGGMGDGRKSMGIS
jgi:hypothetical protein